MAFVFLCKLVFSHPLVPPVYLCRTPLMMAVENGHIESTVFLIRNGAIVNARDADGRTALHRAVSFSLLGF